MTRLDRHYVDPRLVALYDIENPRGADTDFYLALAAELDARRIVDFGCGTGLLTRELAWPGRRLMGIDPAPAMLAYARAQPGAERVQWIEGDLHALGAPEADLVLMTGNVAQVFLEDAEWTAALRAIHAALRPGGHLAFESRNPDARAWESWNRTSTLSRFDSTDGPVETWIELVSFQTGRVKLQGHNFFVSTEEIVVADSELRFRSRDELHRSLRDAGFSSELLYGDWHKGPLVESSGPMIFIARRD